MGYQVEIVQPYPYPPGIYRGILPKDRGTHAAKSDARGQGVETSLIVPVPSLGWDWIMPIKKGLFRGKNCSVCEKQFDSKQSLENCKLIHTDDEPYVCDVCEKAFRKNFKMKMCQLTHTNDFAPSKYTCQECGQMYSPNQSLRETFQM